MHVVIFCFIVCFTHHAIKEVYLQIGYCFHNLNKAVNIVLLEYIYIHVLLCKFYHPMKIPSKVTSAVCIALSCVHYIRSVHLFVCFCVCVLCTGTSNFSFTLHAFVVNLWIVNKNLYT